MAIEYEVQELVWENQKNRNPKLRRVQVWKTFLVGFDIRFITRNYVGNPSYRILNRRTKQVIDEKKILIYLGE